MKLLEPFSSAALSLKNRVVMAPMTRNRASADHVPTPLMADYCGQRAGAGWIITEGTSPSPNGLGYARIPGLFDVSPFGAFNASGAFDGFDAQYVELARAPAELKVSFLHHVDHSSMGAPEVPAAFKAQLRQAFGGTLIVSGGFARDSAEQALAEGRGELVAFARPWLANPDLVERLRRDLPLNPPDFSTFYTPGPKGYTDYPVAA